MSLEPLLFAWIVHDELFCYFRTVDEVVFPFLEADSRGENDFFFLLILYDDGAIIEHLLYFHSLSPPFFNCSIERKVNRLGRKALIRHSTVKHIALILGISIRCYCELF